MTRPLQSRRQFLKTSAAGVGIGATGLLRESRALAAAGNDADSLSFGLVTDVHYADATRRGTRCYRDSQEKLRAAVETFNGQKLPLVAELGDFVDAGPDKAAEIEFLHAIRETFAEFKGRRHYVLGNHCVARLTKTEFLANCGAEVRRSHYSFDCGPYHFVVLDADFKKDGSPYAAGNFQWTDTWIHRPQREWLANDLQQAADKTAVILVHQNLDRDNGPHGVKNGQQIRSILEKAGNVLAVLQGNLHQGGYRKIGSIHYCTLRAMVEGPAVENNAYAVVTLEGTDRITLKPFGRQKPIVFE